MKMSTACTCGASVRVRLRKEQGVGVFVGEALLHGAGFGEGWEGADAKKMAALGVEGEGWFQAVALERCGGGFGVGAGFEGGELQFELMDALLFAGAGGGDGAGVLLLDVGEGAVGAIEIA